MPQSANSSSARRWCFYLWALAGPLLLQFPGYGQSWRWAKAISGSGTQKTYSVTADSAGNTFVCGEFNGLARFGALTLTAPDSSNAFVAKLNSAGQWLWVKALAGPQVQIISKLVPDGAGYVYITGKADSSSTFDGTPVGNGAQTFVAKLASATGTLQWLTRGTGITDLAVSRANIPYVSGDFRGDSLRLGAIRAANTYYYTVCSDVYVASLAPITGQWDWAIATGGGETQAEPMLAIDAQDAIYLAGRYSNQLSGVTDSTRFGSHTLPDTYNVGGGIFLAKLNAGRTWEWATTTVVDDMIYLYDFTIGRNDRLYMTCVYNAFTMLFGPDTVATTPVYLQTPVVMCIAPTTGRLIWGAAPRSGYDQYILKIQTDDEGSVFAYVGIDGDTARLGGLSVQLAPGTTNGRYMAALDSTGQWVWAMPDGGIFCPAPQRRLVLASSFTGTRTFGAISLVNPGVQSDGYVAALGLPAFISSFTPATGPAGTTIILTGTGFAGTTAVLFGGIPATFTLLPNGTLQVVVPAGVSPQGVTISVVGPNGTGQSVSLFGRPLLGLAAAVSPTSTAFALLPNPASGTTRVVAETPLPAVVEVRDALGRVVRRVAGGTTSCTLDVRGLAAGIYTVRAGTTARRLVVE